MKMMEACYVLQARPLWLRATFPKAFAKQIPDKKMLLSAAGGSTLDPLLSQL